MYPPQDSEELASAAEALATGCDLLQEECPLPLPAGVAPGEEGPGAAAEGQAGVKRELAAALAKVEEAQAALSQQLAANDEEGEAVAAAAGATE